MSVHRIMKTVILASLLIFLTACQNTQAERYKTSSVEIDLLKKGLSDYENADWEEWSMQYAESAEIFQNTWIDGASVEEVKARHKTIIAQLSSYSFSKDDRYFEQIIDDKGKTWVNFWGVWKGTLKANSKEIVIPVHLTIQFKDGKVVEEHGYWNTAKLNEELRLLEMATNKDKNESY